MCYIIDEIDITDVVVAQPATVDQIELFMQFMQHIAEMRVEMERIQDLSSLIFSFNPGIPPLQFPPPCVEQGKNPPSNLSQNLPIIDLPAPNPHHVFVSYQVSLPLQSTNLQAPFLLKIPFITKTLTTRTPPSINKINISTPGLILKTTKPLKFPKCLHHSTPTLKSNFPNPRP